MITQQEFQMEEAIKKWNIFFTLLFAVLLAVFLFTFERGDRHFFQSFGLGQAIIIFLAGARIIRLLCYDNITLFIREAFLDVRTVKQVEGGVEHYERVLSENPFKRTVYKLVNCPWCIGVWVTLGVIWLYRDFPILYFAYVILALSQLASMVTMGANFVGWNAEYRKLKTEKLQNNS